MAQGRATDAPVGAAKAPRALTDEEAYEMQQYEKIVRFHDMILSGKHPTIRPPGILSSVAPPPSGSASTADPTGVNGGNQGNFWASSTADAAKKLDLGSVSLPGGGLTPVLAVIPKPFATGKTEINPILLEKSDELIKAEITLQRQRLESALRDEVEQRRFSKIPLSERHYELDLSDVLTKALALVPAIAAPLPAHEELTANHEAASDSFDDNTFYSSQYETPQSHMTSRVRNESEEVPSPDALRQQPILAPQDVDATRERQAQAMTDPRTLAKQDGRHDLPANATAAIAHASIVPGLSNYIGRGNVSAQRGQNKTTNREPTQPEASGAVVPGPLVAGVTTSQIQQPSDAYINSHPPSPLIRGHALQPVAPQPAQISSLVASGQGREAANLVVLPAKGTPAQVAALRNEPSAVTSPDSSSQGGRGSDKKKGKKKKRKAGRQAPEVEANPYIKAEPRSPSPWTAPSYIRANKRQRHSQRQVIELEYEPGYERPLAHGPDGQYLTRQYRDEHMPLGYESPATYAQHPLDSALIGDPRYGVDYTNSRRLPADGHVRGYGLSTAVPLPYPHGVAYPPHPVPQAFAGDGYREPPRSLRGYPEGSHLSVRPDDDSLAEQPRPAQARVMVDAFGREYLDPSHPAGQRSTAPLVGPAEPRVVYKRLPPRAVSRRPGPGSYGDGGVVYGGPQAPYGIPRRVVTQPEYASYDYRDGQHREYATRPMAPLGDVREVEGLGQQRRLDEVPARFPSRATSMMPVEAVRYEVPQGYGRVQSVRPEAAGREYAPSVHPESRREAGQPYIREYAVRPMEAYHRPQPRAAEDIAFIERPRGATQEIVYADDARRAVYR